MLLRSALAFLECACPLALWMGAQVVRSWGLCSLQFSCRYLSPLPAPPPSRHSSWMANDEELMKAMRAADRRDEIGYVRYLCELYLRDNPDHGPTLVRYAIQLVALHLYDEANIVLDHAEATTEKCFHRYVFAQRGLLLNAQGKFAAAEETFLQAHKLVPDDATYLILAGSAAHSSGDIDRASELYRQATQCSEGAIDEAYFNLGDATLPAANMPKRRPATASPSRSAPTTQSPKSA